MAVIGGLFKALIATRTSDLADFSAFRTQTVANERKTHPHLNPMSLVLNVL
jgi:hypothetical protein